MVARGEKREKKSDKLADYDLARQDCEKAVALSSGSADAHFWYGVSMGRWGEAKGILKAMFLIKPIRREMEATLKLQPGHGGAHRVLGEMLWQIPGFAGGDKKAALAEYETAVRLSPNHSANYQPLAEAYLHFGRKDDAIRTLNAVAAIKDPSDPAEYPGDLADAKKLLDKRPSLRSDASRLRAGLRKISRSRVVGRSGEDRPGLGAGSRRRGGTVLRAPLPSRARRSFR